MSCRLATRSAVILIAGIAIAAHSLPAGWGFAPDSDPRLSRTLSPTIGRTVKLQVVKGIVRVRARGSRRFVRLKRPRLVPVGSLVDTRRGTVKLTAAGGKTGATQSGKFHDGRFRVRQKRSAPTTDLLLAGDFGICIQSAKKKRKRHRVRRLWGDARGRFRTRGKYSATTVRGTKWLTEDRCGETVTKVARGTVEVRDFVEKQTVVVAAPQAGGPPSTYVAMPPQPRRGQ